MDVAMSSFDIKLLKALGNYKYSHFPPKNNVEVQLDQILPRLNNIDQARVRGGTIVVPNPRDSCSVDKKVKNS